METKTQLKPKTSLKSKANLAKPKKPKKKSISTLKKEADKAFSRYIRYRDGKKDASGNWIVECITCGEWRPYSVMQNGHFMSRRHNIIRFDEENCNGQCLTEDSNVYMYGNYKKSIADLIVGDAVLAFDEGNFSKTVATVLNVRSFVPEKLYKVTTVNGDVFYATADHRVVANNKWMRIDDMLHDVSAYDILEL